MRKGRERQLDIFDPPAHKIYDRIASGRSRKGAEMKARISQFQSRHFKWRKGILRYQSEQICPENTHQALLFIDFWRIVW